MRRDGGVSSLLPVHGFAKGTGLILIIILSATPFINTSAATIELAYDDCGAEGFWSYYHPNGMSVRFSPPAFSIFARNQWNI